MVSDPSVVFVELNEADVYFLDKLVGEGKLPTFSRMLAQGARVTTRVPGWRASEPKAWRTISPWIVWPSIYTGLAPHEHGMVALGQDTSGIRGRCIWDVLDREGVSTGVLGSLLSYPPRGSARFYVPESLADDAACYPAAARPVQEFAVFAARNYSKAFWREAVEGTLRLLGTLRAGVSAKTVLRTLAQVPREKLAGPSQVPERALLHTAIMFDAFRALYAQFRPSFATLHLNHVAYMQHRYWRAAEPHRYAETLSTTDARFFSDVSQRRAYEGEFAQWIERSFTASDALLAELIEMVDSRTVIVLATGLGQVPMDPSRDIHNPVVRLVNEHKLFDGLGLQNYEVLHQMNPDVTVNFDSDAAATAAANEIAGLTCEGHGALFTVQHAARQVFVELNLPKREKGAPWPAVRHETRSDYVADLAQHVEEHFTNDQSTAHHTDRGLMLAWSRGRTVRAARPSVSITEIAPTLLSWFGLEPEPWMSAGDGPAMKLD